MQKKVNNNNPFHKTPYWSPTPLFILENGKVFSGRVYGLSWAYALSSNGKTSFSSIQCVAVREKVKL